MSNEQNDQGKQSGPLDGTGAYRTQVIASDERIMLVDPYGFDLGGLEPTAAAIIVNLLNREHELGDFAPRTCPTCHEAVHNNGAGHAPNCRVEFGQYETSWSLAEAGAPTTSA